MPGGVAGEQLTLAAPYADAPFFGMPKKKPAIDTDAGFPVFSLPSS
jgi:hypothetical protein